MWVLFLDQGSNMPPKSEANSLHHWTIREVPQSCGYKTLSCPYPYYSVTAGDLFIRFFHPIYFVQLSTTKKLQAIIKGQKKKEKTQSSEETASMRFRLMS